MDARGIRIHNCCRNLVKYFRKLDLAKIGARLDFSAPPNTINDGIPPVNHQDQASTVRFEWDPSKAAANVRKHGVSFGQACGVFLDKYALSLFDKQPEAKTMKKEYDFTNAEQGRFHRKPEQLEVPVYLDKDVADRLRAKGQGRAADLSDVVNSVLRKDLELVEMLKK